MFHPYFYGLKLRRKSKRRGNSAFVYCQHHHCRHFDFDDVNEVKTTLFVALYILASLGPLAQTAWNSSVYDSLKFKHLIEFSDFYDTKNGSFSLCLSQCESLWWDFFSLRCKLWFRQLWTIPPCSCSTFLWFISSCRVQEWASLFCLVPCSPACKYLRGGARSSSAEYIFL